MAGSAKKLFKRKMHAHKSGKPWEFLKTEAKAWERRGKKMSGELAQERAQAAADADPVLPMPDEEEIKRSRRRSASSRGGGRASTILTDGDRLGP